MFAIVVASMETLYRVFSGLLAALGALFAPIIPLIHCVILFVGIDFVIGVAADRARTLRNHEVWYFESRRAWRTILKAGFLMIAIAMAWLLDCCILEHLDLQLARLFAGFVCGVELWSFLENAGELSDAPLFRALRRIAHRKMTKGGLS